ncbi:branched-chain amino acid ABC transporter substrate-binding protein [Trinickia soli]|uniref:Branched chain amino acid ABC transporter substrate-binding protein n=1 Tax=Trinickia soli TaxID=380675 RepID=A0A2N7VTS8_9BURK|nr:branched-chain amino acid ABC transporter substrate-binding protein [Trinickia soli]KAA0079642.1 branched-chain amino acid ABC transporter substrate-binding protein [Paraburkholderia sp. T12-10]PMS20545.1 branched chain amino acid ABC transporter substrate-binding protein [Trinickia soli]CAB3725855.1 Leucine-, isoleucine-, valine-, threonine-, and alanine-binding protein [Trinickia soli]
MNSKMQKLLPISAAAMLAATMATGAAADEIVKIGHVAPLTGQIAHLGKDNENGARLAVEEINKKGLVIGGQKVTLQLDAQDDAADPRTATQVAQKLVDDKVVAVVGHLNSGTTIPASKIYSDAGIAQISPSATNPQYTLQGFKTTFRVVATDAQQGPALANYAAKTLNLKKVAIVDDATAYGQGLANEFEKTAKSLGMTVLSHDATNDKAVDFRAILTKIKGEGPDAIMYGGMDATGGPFAKQAKQLGIKAKILAGDGVCTDQLSTLAGDATDNVVCSEAGRSLEKMGKAGQEFEAKYKARFGVPIQIYAPFTYDAVYIIVDAMKRANSTDPAKILAALPSTDYKGVIGETQFDAHGDLKHGVISLYNYKAGKKTLLNEVAM